MDSEKAEKERQNARFAREELGALLKLFSSLGITVSAGILGFFWLGLHLQRKATEAGWQTYGLVLVGFVLGGVALSVYWAYLRIGRHLDKFDSGAKKDGAADRADKE